MGSQLHAVCVLPATRSTVFRRNGIETKSTAGNVTGPCSEGTRPRSTVQGSLPSLQRALRRLPHPRPTLFVWGERIFNALIADSEPMYKAPKLLGVDTQLVI